MNRQEYMHLLKNRLERLPKEDFEKAIDYYEEYFDEAGVENEAKAIENLGTPSDAADQIIRDMALSYSKEPVKNVKAGFNTLRVVLLSLGTAPLTLPILLVGVLAIVVVIIVILAVFLTLVFAAMSGVLVGLLTMIAGCTVIVDNIPVFINCLGIGLMYTGLGLALTYVSCLFGRKSLGWLIRVFGKIVRIGGRKNA